MKFGKLGALAGVGVLVFAGCQGGTTGGGKGNLKIAIDLPLQGSDKAASDPIVNGVKLAIKEANAATTAAATARWIRMRSSFRREAARTASIHQIRRPTGGPRVRNRSDA